VRSGLRVAKAESGGRALNRSLPGVCITLAGRSEAADRIATKQTPNTAIDPHASINRVEPIVAPFPIRYFSASTTGPDTGSVTPRPPPRSSSVSRNESRVAIMYGRAFASESRSVHSAMMQKVRSPVFAEADSFVALWKDMRLPDGRDRAPAATAELCGNLGDDVWLKAAYGRGLVGRW
jgi:hypothetical protein